MGKKLFILTLILFVTAIILTIHAEVAYPKPIYEEIYPSDPRYTGEVVEWFDRASGWNVQRILVYDPDNPGWVEVFQSGMSFFILFGLFILVALAGPREKNRSKFTE